jgi:hypothetical protein
LTPFPPLRPTSAIDQDFYAGLSGFLNDHLPLRDLVVTTSSLMAIKVWRDSPNPDVHIGANGWLYTTPFRSNCPDGMPLEVIDALATLGRAFAATGREMRLILAPNKAAIYPEYLGAFPPAHFACGLERLNALRTGLARIPEIGSIDLAARLTGLKDHAVEPLYFPGDSHWTLRGAVEMSHALVDSIEPGLWRQGDVEETGRIEVPGSRPDDWCAAACDHSRDSDAAGGHLHERDRAHRLRAGTFLRHPLQVVGAARAADSPTHVARPRFLRDHVHRDARTLLRGHHISVLVRRRAPATDAPHRRRRSRGVRDIGPVSVLTCGRRLHDTGDSSASPRAASLVA